MFKQKSRLSLALALAIGVAVTGCGGGVDQEAAVAGRPTSAPVTAAGDVPATSAVASESATSQVATPEPQGDAAGGSSAAPTAVADAGPSIASKVPDSANAAAALPLLVVTKSATCGCCHLWVEHMQKAGFKVEVHDVDDINVAKERVGVPYGKGSCHTAEVGGYFIEGHVPAEDVKRLLAEKPNAKGLTVPGMPMGSPGMEVPDGRVQPYVVELVARDGSTSPFAHHGH